MKTNMTFMEHLIGSVIICVVVMIFFGVWAAIGLFILFIASYVFGDKKDSEETEIVTPSKSPKQKTVLDTVHFTYKDIEGQITERTVDLYTGIKGPRFKGHCHLRDEERTFYFDRIQGDQIIRIETGEVLTLEDWRNELRTMRRQ